MPETCARIAVIGGMNMDIGGFPDGTFGVGDSIPGRVHMSAGGVGRNIAENAARLGMHVELISAIGDDANGRFLLEDCRAKGIGTGGICTIKGSRTSVYLFVDDARGDMHCAINDMEVQKNLTPEALAPRLDVLNAMDAVAMDANLPEDSIRYLAETLTVPLFADAVSAAKVGKFRSVLGHLHCLKPNRIEAEQLTGMRIQSVEDASEAAKRLNGMGVRRVFLTLGMQGAVCAEEERCCFVPCMARGVVNASGAGDAFTAALIWAHCAGLGLEQSGAAGMAAAGIAVRALEAVSPRMNRTNLMKTMDEIMRRN